MDAATFQSIEQAVTASINHVVARGSDDIFKPPVFSKSLEHQIINGDVAEFTKKARSDTINFIKDANLKSCKIGPIFQSLIAKDDRSFRQVAWIDPFDAVKYLAVCYLLFDKIEAARIPKAEGYVHSHRKADNINELFDKNYGYDSFRARSGQLSRERLGQWKITTDISNFFDRIGNHSLENHLLDIGCDKKYVTLLREILLFWAGDRRSYGVPVGSDASRIASEAILIDIDRKLKDKSICFVRYVDDFRLFAETRAEAYAQIQLLTSLLADEGLALNAKKTSVYKILDADDPHLNANLFGDEEHQVIDIAEKIEIQRHVRVSGRTHIARFYKEPGKEAVKRIQSINKEDLISKFIEIGEELIEEKLKLLIKYFIYADQDIKIINTVLERKITSIFYICDALIKEVDKFDQEKKNEILECIFSSEEWTKAPYPYHIPVLRLTSTDGFRDTTLVNLIFDNHKISGNAIFFREFITLSYCLLDRARMRTLALDMYPVAPAFLKRAIFYAVANHPSLSEDERRPLLKNMAQHPTDWFLDRIPGPV